MKKNIFILLIIIFVLYWSLWIAEVKVAPDFFYWYPDLVKSLFNIPLLWREVLAPDGFGQDITFSLFIWPVLLIYGIFSNIDYSILSRLIGFIPFVFLGIFGIYNLLTSFKITGWGRAVGTILYLTNSYILLLLDGGQIYLALAYSILPFAFLYYRRVVEFGELKEKVFFILSVAAISIFDIRILYFVFGLIFLSFIFDIFSSKKVLSLLRSNLSLGFFAVLLLILIHLPWILPSIFAKAPGLPLTYDRPQQLDFLSVANLDHSIYLMQPHWFLNIFGQVSSVRIEFVLIPILVFMALILKRKDKVVAFWGVVAIVSVFLTKGSAGPFPQVYQFLFDHFPGFVFFRDSSKFYFLVALSYSILLAISIDSIIKLKTKLSLPSWIFRVFPLLVIIYLIILARPVFLGQMTGLFSSPLYKLEYQDLANFLNKDDKYSRILYVPHHAPLGFSTPTHPAVDALYLTNKRPFAIGGVGTYEAVNYLREASFMGQILDVSGISYIVFPPLDPRRDDMHPDSVRHYNTFIDQVSKLSWISGKEERLKIPILRTKNHQDRVFLASNLWWVIGSDNLYKESTKSAQLKLSNNALVFVEELAGLGMRINDYPEAKIVLNNKDLNDLAATFIDSSKLIFPAKNLGFNPDKSGWWKREAVDVLWWKDFLQQKYSIKNQDFDLGGGWAVAEGNKNLSMSEEKLNQGDILLARVMESSRGGQLKFLQGSSLIGEINTKNNSSEGNIRWFEVGKLPTNATTLSIESAGDINVVNTIAVLKSEEWESYKNKSENLIQDKRVVDFNNINVATSEAQIKYEKINSTKYRVSISGLQKPEFLIFSQSYDPLWKMGDKNPLPVYSLFNVYRIEKNGEYNLDFEAQKYVYPGFVISLLSLFGFGVILFLSCRRSK